MPVWSRKVQLEKAQERIDKANAALAQAHAEQVAVQRGDPCPHNRLVSGKVGEPMHCDRCGMPGMIDYSDGVGKKVMLDG